MKNCVLKIKERGGEEGGSDTLFFMCKIHVPAMYMTCAYQIHAISGHHRLKVYIKEEEKLFIKVEFPLITLDFSTNRNLTHGILTFGAKTPKICN